MSEKHLHVCMLRIFGRSAWCAGPWRQELYQKGHQVQLAKAKNAKKCSSSSLSTYIYTYISTYCIYIYIISILLSIILFLLTRRNSVCGCDLSSVFGGDLKMRRGSLSQGPPRVPLHALSQATTTPHVVDCLQHYVNRAGSA